MSFWLWFGTFFVVIPACMYFLIEIPRWKHPLQLMFEDLETYKNTPTTMVNAPTCMAHTETVEMSKEQVFPSMSGVMAARVLYSILRKDIPVGETLAIIKALHALLLVEGGEPSVFEAWMVSVLQEMKGDEILREWPVVPSDEKIVMSGEEASKVLSGLIERFNSEEETLALALGIRALTKDQNVPKCPVCGKPAKLQRTQGKGYPYYACDEHKVAAIVSIWKSQNR